MKWLLTFLAGLLLGAGSLFVYLRTVPVPKPAQVVVVAPAAPATPAAAAAPAGVSLPVSELPGVPVVSTDLSELDLPLRPATSDVATPTASPAATPTTGKLMIPVDGIKLASLRDNFDQPRGTERHHEALDIMAPKGTKVVAAADGKLVKLFNSKPGGLTVYQFDPSEKYAYYYAHLDRYAEGVKEGMDLKRGDLIGYVGVTGNSDPNAPHLHFAVVELTAEKKWWKGTPINPFPLMGE
ncbi:M23 family metallopeptidase [Massilia sp. P8910]|uniref:M23 family metallopeptidase n=1 Tax=Massilia antarctica TaxID=2765360 RepID=UPI0006BB5F92|nr:MULTISPECIES: M23 family metallopeptidase [Massilia]MCE3605676.1 M23 family metallopeptidase [Massilia antarctica]MCY0912740.1 M23 family metallopeptidase [Massilia sp. H27-R4]CUI03810.1 peptidase, M23/M37 family [Janthinobacterium sp. CG23_2]CUU27596.1 peptidase, M23/M37 family [Janthinobacterium sp. CG23_2]